MLRNILPEKIYLCFKNIDLEQFSEVRLRSGSPIVLLGSKKLFLSFDGITNDSSNAIVCTSSLIDDILHKISNNSLYTINDQLIQGYVTIDGVRIGVAGEFVMVSNSIKTIKNITSLNIRIPHLIKNCSLPIFNYLVNSTPLNTLIISPPGAGKTTFLRDFIYQISSRIQGVNILVVDERSEITSITENIFVGVDVYKNCTKKYAFENGIRSMKPDIIFTDEINLSNDIETIENALTSGVKVVATIHANSVSDLKNKKEFKSIIDKKMFDRYVVLGFSNGVGTIEGVFNESFRCVYV